MTPGLTAALDRFDSQLRATSFPATAQPDALRLESATTRATGALRQMTAARTAVTFSAAALEFAVAAREVDVDAHRLVTELS